MPEWYGGYILSKENPEHWEAQWARVNRWFKLVKYIRDKSYNTKLSALDFDIYIAFFMNCYHLRDWIKAYQPNMNEPLNELFRNNFEMKACRDICNGFKHVKLDRNPLDADFNLVRTYDYLEEMGSKVSKNPVKYIIAFAYGDEIRKFDIFELAERCISIWEEFVSQRILNTRG